MEVFVNRVLDQSLEEIRVPPLEGRLGGVSEKDWSGIAAL